jgi:hypothetical protein
MLEAKARKVSVLLSDPNISDERCTKLSARHLQITTRINCLYNNQPVRGCGRHGGHRRGLFSCLFGHGPRAGGKGKGGMCHGKGKEKGKGAFEQHDEIFEGPMHHPHHGNGKGKGMHRKGKGMHGKGMHFEQEVFEEFPMHCHLKGHHRGKGKGGKGWGKRKGKGLYHGTEFKENFDAEFEILDKAPSNGIKEDYDVVTASPLNNANDAEVDDMDLAFAIALSMENDSDESEDEDA